MVGAAQTVSGLANYPYTIACKTGTPQRSEYTMVGQPAAVLHQFHHHRLWSGGGPPDRCGHCH